jgi:hypothetical protein
VSFQNQSDWNKYDQFNFKTKGSISKVNSISLLNKQLKTLYTFHYNNKKLLYISRFIYESDKFIKIVVNVTGDRGLDIDESFKLDKIKKFLEVNDNIVPVSIIFPNIHPNYVCYSWLLEDNYMNELFIKPIFEKVYKAIND